MKLSKLALLCALAGALSAGNAHGQTGGRQPAVERTAFEYGNYYAQEEPAASPSDKAPAAEAPAATGSCCNTCSNPCDDCCNSCDRCGCGGLLDPCCKLGTPWKLFDGECLKCKGINIGGWVNGGYTWNTTNPVDKFNGPMTWVDRANEPMLNNMWIFAEKAIKADSCCWELGGRVDFDYGEDPRYFTQSGVETRGNFTSPKWSTQRFFTPALPQFYAEMGRNDLRIKVGHFLSPVGYEVVPTTQNFFSTLPMTFQYGEAFTHTGALATKKFSEKVTAGFGIIRGWDNFDNSTHNLGVLTTYTRTFENKASYAYVGVASNEPNLSPTTATQTGRYLQTQVYTRPLDDHWTYVGQSDYGYQNNAFGPGTKDARWYGLNQYLFYKFSDCFTWGTRAEWFRDEEGFRVGGFLNDPTSGFGDGYRGLPNARSGYAGSFYEVTTGFNYKPNANFVIRPSVRFDWFSGTSPAANLRPYDGGSGNSNTILGFDVIALF